MCVSDDSRWMGLMDTDGDHRCTRSRVWTATTTESDLPPASAIFLLFLFINARRRPLVTLHPLLLKTNSIVHEKFRVLLPMGNLLMRIDPNFPTVFADLGFKRKMCIKRCDFESSGVTNIEVQTKKM